jgi:hypothetical protein
LEGVGKSVGFLRKLERDGEFADVNGVARSGEIHR